MPEGPEGPFGFFVPGKAGALSRFHGMHDVAGEKRNQTHGNDQRPAAGSRVLGSEDIGKYRRIDGGKEHERTKA